MYIFVLYLCLVSFFGVFTTEAEIIFPPTPKDQTISCYGKCKCRDDIVVCEDIELTTYELEILAPNISNNTKVLYLSNNNLTNFALKILGNLTELQGLHLRRNLLSHIPDHKNGDLRKLKILDLEDNRISSLSESDFIGYGGLHSLYLNRNSIMSLESDTVFKYLVHLRELLLDDNLIKEISRLTIRRLIDLSLLSLSNNMIEELEPGMFDGLQYLRDVLFHNNNLQKIPNYLFSKNNYLSLIDFSSNQIHELPEYGFANMTNIGKLDILLSYNHLKSVSQTTFQNSKQLYVSLEGNMFHCDCPLLASVNRFQQLESNHVIGGECLTPLHLEGRSLSAMTNVELQCDICDVYECQNAGNCISAPNSHEDIINDEFHCECKDGYSGTFCQTYNPPTTGNEKKKLSTATWIAIAISILVVCGGAFIALVVCRRRKKPTSYIIQETDDSNELI